MSIAEAGYVSLSACWAQVIWMRTRLLDYGYRYTKIPMYCDSKSEIAIFCNSVQHSRTKHINIRYHFIKEHVEQGTIELYFVGTEYQLANLFTKALPKERFEYLVHMIGMRCMTPMELERQAKQVITYTVDMFRATLKLPVETPDNPFIVPFMKIVGYQGDVDKDFLYCVQQQKDVIQYPRFTKLIIANLMQKFDSIPKRLEKDYYSIKDNIPLVSVYTTRNVKVRGMLILDEFLTDDIRATKEYKEYEKVFVRKKLKRKQVAGETSSPKQSLKIHVKQIKPSTNLIPPPSDDRERDEIAEATILSLTMHKTTIVAEAKENVAKVQQKIMEEDIDKMVDGEDEKSYASEYADSVFQDDEDGFGIRIDTGSHKEHPKTVNDDDVEEKNDDKNDDDNDDHTNHTLVTTQVTGSSETRKEKMQTPIPSPHRSPRTDLSSDKTLSQELKATEKMQEILVLLKNIILELTVAKTNELIKEAVPSLVNAMITKDREIAPTNVPELISQEFATHAPKIIRELFQSHMENVETRRGVE
ncbi:hypothetical protein Tco_1377978 [Tanacetum coccineum]